MLGLVIVFIGGKAKQTLGLHHKVTELAQKWRQDLHSSCLKTFLTTLCMTISFIFSCLFIFIKVQLLSYC